MCCPLTRGSGVEALGDSQSSELGTCRTAEARSWPYLSGEGPPTVFSRSLFEGVGDGDIWHT